MDLTNINHETIKRCLEALETASLNRVFDNPGLAAGGTATNFQLTNTFGYCIAGIAYRKAAANNIAAPGVNTTGTQYRKVLIQINAAGTVSTVAGDVSTVSQADAVLPSASADNIGIGYLELPVSFTSGTTDVTAGMCKPMVLAVSVDATVGG